MLNFKREQRPEEEHPRFVCCEKGLEITVYYGTPPQKARGIYIASKGQDSGTVLGICARELAKFDLAALEDVTRQIYVT